MTVFCLSVWLPRCRRQAYQHSSLLFNYECVFSVSLASKVSTSGISTFQFIVHYDCFLCQSGFQSVDVRHINIPVSCSTMTVFSLSVWLPKCRRQAYQHSSLLFNYDCVFSVSLASKVSTSGISTFQFHVQL